MMCMYLFQDLTGSNHSVKREPASREVAGVGKKDTGKSTKKAGMLLLHLCSVNALICFCCY